MSSVRLTSSHRHASPQDPESAKIRIFIKPRVSVSSLDQMWGRHETVHRGSHGARGWAHESPSGPALNETMEGIPQAASSPCFTGGETGTELERSYVPKWHGQARHMSTPCPCTTHPDSHNCWGSESVLNSPLHPQQAAGAGAASGLNVVLLQPGRLQGQPCGAWPGL